MSCLCLSKAKRFPFISQITLLANLLPCKDISVGLNILEYVHDQKVQRNHMIYNKLHIYALTLLSKYFGGNIRWCSTHSKYGFCNLLCKAKICQFQCSRLICIMLNLHTTENTYIQSRCILRQQKIKEVVNNKQEDVLIIATSSKAT